MMKALSMYELNKERYDRLDITDWDEYRKRKRNKRKRKKKK